MANYHLVILKKPYLDTIVDGKKTIESRFMMTKKEPFGQIMPGDKLFLKESSGPVLATAAAEKVESFENLSVEKMSKIKEKYNDRILGPDEYWQSKADCRYGVLIWLADVRQIEPVRIEKKDWRAWVVLSSKKNYGLFNTDKELF